MYLIANEEVLKLKFGCENVTDTSFFTAALQEEKKETGNLN